MASVDVAVFLWLNGWVGHFPFLDATVRVLVSDYLVPVIFSLTLLGLWFWGKDHWQRDRHQRAVIVGMIGLGIANLGVMLINQHYFRPRPFNDHEVALLFYRPVDSSFPANPVAVAFAVAAGVWGGHRRAGASLYILAALFGMSRVYAGVSYPLDAVAGALIGITASLLVSRILRLMEPIPTLVLRLARLFYLA